MLKAAESPALPIEQRRQVVVAAWVRSVLLGNETSGKQAAQVLEAEAPDLKKGLEEYNRAATEDERRFAAVWLLLQRPELVPEVRGGVGREAVPGEIDPFRNNWWCPLGSKPSNDDYQTRYYDVYTPWMQPMMELYRGQDEELPGFLSEDANGAALKVLARRRTG